MNEIAISVIIPVYNVEKYLTKCLDSVFGQDFTNFEVICVEDGSTDNSGNILREYAIEHPNMKIFWGQGNHGLSYARNRGLDMAEGKYVFFLDSDDWIKAETFSRLYQLAEISKVEMLFFEDELGNEDGSIRATSGSRYNGYEGIHTGKEFFCHMIKIKQYAAKACEQFVLLKFLRNESLHFNEGMLHEDMLYTFMALMKATRVAASTEKLYIYRQRAGSICNSFPPLRYQSILFCLIEIISYWKLYSKDLSIANDSIQTYAEALYELYLMRKRQSDSETPFSLGCPADKFLYDIIQNPCSKQSIHLTDPQITLIRSAKRRFIYGAGKQAVVLLDVLRAYNTIVDCFLVTEPRKNAKHIDEIPVNCIFEIKLEPDDVVLIAVHEKHITDVVANIQRQGKCQYLYPKWDNQ